MLKRKLVEWEAKRRATPLIAKWLHMQVKRSAFRRRRRLVVGLQARRRGAQPQLVAQLAFSMTT